MRDYHAEKLARQAAKKLKEQRELEKRQSRTRDLAAVKAKQDTAKQKKKDEQAKYEQRTDNSVWVLE